jgi:hypothetical protein
MQNNHSVSRLINGLLFVFLCSVCVVGPAQATYTPAGSSFGDVKTNNIYPGNAHQSSADTMNQPQKTEGSDSACTYKAGQVGGATAGAAQLDVTTPTPETVAQKAVPNQNVPQNQFKTHATGFTVCTDPTKNHAGPPKPGDIPFEFIPPFAFKEGDKNNLNPATYKNQSYATGCPTSDLTAQMADAMNAEHLANQLNTPNAQGAMAEQQGQAQQAGEAVNAAGNNQFAANLKIVQTYLINVANENAGAPGGGSGPKTLPQAIGMVQQMYKNVYLPIALLLLLPGAVATQVMCVVHKGMRLDDSEEISSPFTGIMRALVAVFLIPATQLIVSYSIDVGNSMTGAITDNLSTAGISSWVDGITNPTPNQTPQQKTDAANAQTTVAAMQDMVYGTISMLASDGLMILTQWQVVIACYLLLLGPIAACFFAWPSKVGKLFKPVFSNWLDALFNLVLWRFWWCVILLCMATRLQWLADIGEPTNGPWERLVFMSFQVMLTYVPFMALEFKPGSLVDQLMEKTKGSSGKQGSGGTKSMTQHNRGLTTKGTVA